MAEAQRPTIVEGATTGDVDDEIPVAAKSAEDRKAAAALSSLDAPREDDATNTKDVDQEAVRKAMDRLAGAGAANGKSSKKGEEKTAVKKIVKVDPADVTLLVCLSRIYNTITLHKDTPFLLSYSCFGSHDTLAPLATSLHKSIPSRRHKLHTFWNSR
jgi:hypothetical protein